jgi:hypothetical protein
MYLHKTTGTTANKTAPEPPVRNAASKPPPSQAAKSSAPVPPAPAPRSTSALIAAAGLPTDKLSASIVSFARFFSLPLKPELMAAMRRQTLAHPAATQTATQADAVKQALAENVPAQNAADSAAAKIREALSLAAVAAESKGVELHPKGLEAFAEAIDPEWQKREDSNGRGRRNNNRQQQEEENAPDKNDPITAAGLKQMALESAEKNPLLAILNRLPGKNGRRWIVLPFSFDEGGREFKVSLRILLEADQSPHRAVCMAATCVALDIAESERRWLFALESANGLPAKKLAVYLQPELPPAAHAPFARALSELMQIPLERISIRNRAESFPCESGGADDLLRSINEAV